MGNAMLDQEEIREVEVLQIKENPYQPRRHFSQEEIEELAVSFQTVGIIQPPVVHRLDDGTFELISGERRLRAAKLAGYDRIPVLVRKSDQTFSAQAALIENIQRVDLNPLEIAKALRSLIEEFDYNQDELAAHIGKKRSTIANYLRLLSLPKSIQESISKQLITMGHAKAILSLHGFDKQKKLFEMILEDELSVREAEKAAEKIAKGEVEKKGGVYSNRDCHLQSLSDRIQERLGTKVMIQGRGKRGKISIDYYDLDDLDRILALLGVSEV